MIMKIIDNDLEYVYDPVKFFNENDLNPEKMIKKLNDLVFEDKVQFILDTVDPEVTEINA